MVYGHYHKCGKIWFDSRIENPSYKIVVKQKSCHVIFKLLQDHNGYAQRLCSCCETIQSIVAQEGLFLVDICKIPTAVGILLKIL
nr:MAG TPA: hypothetical protein [Bacteriophage sp.]